MMKRLFAGRFIRSIGYLLSVHLVALLFFFGLRVALFIATDYDFPKEISEDYAFAKRGVPARPLVRQRHRLLHPAAAVGGILDSRMVRLHRPLALPLLCVLLHLFLFAVFHHFRSQYPLFRLLLQAHQFLHIQLVRLRGTTAGMVFGETSYYHPIALGLTAIAAFACITLRLSRAFFHFKPEPPRPRQTDGKPPPLRLWPEPPL